MEIGAGGGQGARGMIVVVLPFRQIGDVARAVSAARPATR